MPTHGRLFAAALFLLAACGSGEDAAEPQEDRATAQTEGPAEVADSDPTLLDVLTSEERFSTLAMAIDAAELSETMAEGGPYTVFAPNNDAFANLPEGISIEVLTAPENHDLLREILYYHVVAGRVEAEDLVGEASTIETVDGSALEFDGTGPVVTVGAAVVTIPDIEAENGVIHVIDTVLLPPAD